MGLFDEIEAFLAKELPEAVEWIGSGLDVRYDEDFRSELAEARRSGQFAHPLEAHEYRHDMYVKMDFALPDLLRALDVDSLCRRASARPAVARTWLTQAAKTIFLL